MTRDNGDERGAVGNVTVVLAVVGLGLATVAGVTLADVGAPSGEEILDSAEETYESADSVVGTATVTVENETTTREYAVEFAATDDNETRVSVAGDDGAVSAGTNGSVAWVHDEETGVTRVVEADESGANVSDAVREHATGLNETQNETLREAGDRFRTFLWDWSDENTTAERIGQETVDGTDAWVVEVTSTNESRDGVATLWIAVDSAEVVKQRFAGDDGVVTVRYTETAFDVDPADSTFQPPGDGTRSVQTVDSFAALQETTTLTVPQLEADGYEFAEGRLLAYGGETALATYEGAATVNVVVTTAERPPTGSINETAVERVDLGGVTANVTERDGRVVVAWQDDGATVAVVTDADRETAIALAESLVGAADDGSTERVADRPLVRA